MNLEEKTVKKNYIYKGKIVNLRKDDAMLPNGKMCIREIVEHAKGVVLAALTEDNELIFVRQFRYPYMQVVLELPAGKVEESEDPLEAGKRELLEETGVTAEEYIDLGEFYPSCGFTDEIIYMYLAKGLSQGKQHLDEDEFLNVEKIPLQKAVDMVMKNEIPDGKTQSLILKAFLKLKEGK